MLSISAPQVNKLQIELPKHIITKIEQACNQSGLDEIGGMLFGEHIDNGYFRVADLSIDEQGLIATFRRSINHALYSCKQFFKNTGHDYRRFNYLGEWHSHPSYSVSPSSCDDRSMLEIVCDEGVGANFVVLVIVRLDGEELQIGGWAYFPDKTRIDVDIKKV